MMPGTRCTVAFCTNSLQKAKKQNRKISFHCFPKNKVIRDIWIQRCQRDGEWNPSSCHICSDHFQEDDYERDLKSELLNLMPRSKKLKSSAIPSINLYTVQKQDSPTNAREQILHKKCSNVVMVDEMVEVEHSQKESIYEDGNDPLSMSNGSSGDYWRLKCEELKQQLLEKDAEVRLLMEQNNNYKHRIALFEERISNDKEYIGSLERVLKGCFKEKKNGFAFEQK